MLLRRVVVPVACAALALLLPGVPASAAPHVAATAAAGDGWGGVATWPVNRTVDTDAYDDAGTFSFTDRWSDATGANADGKHREDYFAGLPEADTLTYDAFGTHRSARNGDYYPPTDDARFPELSADVVFVQLRPAGDGLDVRVVLTSLGEADSSILTLALATGSGTGTSSLPRGAGLTCTGCGVERYVTVWGTGSEIAAADGTATGTVQHLAVDLDENEVVFHVPGVDTSGAHLRAWLASGLHDGSGHYLPVQASGSTTAPGGGTGTGTNVFDLAFVHDDRVAIDERVQSDLLAAGELAPAHADVDLAALRSGVHRVDGEPTQGPVEKVLVSASNQGDGQDSGNGASTFQNPSAGDNIHYLGRLQGYLVDLPPGYRPGIPVPEVVQLHGYNGFYDELWFLAPATRKAVEDAGYVGVYPLGRGDVQYEHDGERDVLEVQQAVERDYAVDVDRVHLLGISMGGFGATKMAVRHADVFADTSVFVGGEEGDVNVVNDRVVDYPVTRAVADVVGNLQDTPVLFGASAADADPLGASASVVYEQLRQVGDEAHLKQYLLGTHEPQIVDYAVPQMTQLWKRSVRQAVPARVRYGFDTSWDFGPLVDDGSAWLQGLQPASGTQGTATADARTLPRALTALEETMSNGGSPADRSLYLLRDSLRTTTGARAVENALTLGLTGVSSATVDLAALQVDTARRYCLDLTSDGPATVRLTGLALSGLAVAGVPAAANGSDLVLTVPSGTTAAVVAPPGTDPAPGTACPTAAAAAAAAAAPGSGARAGSTAGAATGGAPAHVVTARSLARTGSGAALPLAGVVLLGGVAALRRRRTVRG